VGRQLSLVYAGVESVMNEVYDQRVVDSVAEGALRILMLVRPRKRDLKKKKERKELIEYRYCGIVCRSRCPCP
jgi:hypothetical protein